MDINTLRSAVTVVSLVVFIAIVWWAVAARNRSRFEQAAQLPLLEE
ncbi:CcoQ/FixQ family Cbb3-type cytochrome c oxidase assembly chaperone [Variovorax sp. PCZ-1]|nr:CcoQ/FixQ family Cbb3-type cytochrome c oxidase assembly chaperone [Variovorax sp. PCZ-1]MBS7807716.1 CcoQ/FixQ family Cbb3-type cytochrome c oxidase assembly chaperone [Variovorax sp. PCZ-1]